MTGSSLSFDAPKVAVTADQEQVYHMLSDAQLNLIEKHGGSTMLDISLVFIGAFVGLLKDLVSGVMKLYSTGSLDAGETAALTGAAVCLATGSSLFFAAKANNDQMKDVIGAIRSRPAQRQA